jgi:hypothetical protein
MILYANKITTRLRYIIQFIGSELLPQKMIDSTDDIVVYKNYQGPKINYSNKEILDDEFRLCPHTLLFETGINEQVPDVFQVGDKPIFFKTDGDIPFDIFAASFYLLSRYEEYLPHEKDMYGRYAYENSLAFQKGFLDKPLINYWLLSLREALQKKFPSLEFRQHSFQFKPTYDIDEAWSYKHKDWWRSAGASIKDFLKGKKESFKLRRQVLNNKEADPFDSYDWMDNQHRHYQLKPWYFFLVPEKIGKYDRNILPKEIALQTLIRKHADKYDTGVHPSWQSGDDTSLLKKEKEQVETITQKKVIASRQHFIRFTLPNTYRQLIDAGIEKDFSMGYGTINGFRASVASPFYWYDLEKEQMTHLLVYPFCYMEANSYFEQKIKPAEALQEMLHYYEQVKNVHGLLITIWHNTFLGTDKKFEGWREAYKQFLDIVHAERKQ